MNWTSDLAYAVGLITTDGSLSKDGRHLNLTSKDLDQIQNFAKVLDLKAKISLKKGAFTDEKKYYFIQFGDVKLYRFLLSIGLYPNKSKTLNEILIPDVFFADFLRGHLDGDGYTYSYWDKRWKSSFLLYTGFISASKDHLEWIKRRIGQLYKIRGNIKYSGKSVYHLVYAKRASILLLRKIYHEGKITYLARKKFKIDVALDIINKQAGMLELVDRHV